MAEEQMTYTANDDGTIVVKDSGGTEVRYAKEADLLAVKGSRDELQKKAEAAGVSQESMEAVNKQLSEATNKLTQAEAARERLEEQIKAGGGTAEELAKAKSELETAKTSGEESSVKLLELRRAVITATYGVPRGTVDEKDLAALDVYEQALKDVLGQKQLGNLALNAGGGGANALEGKSPRELAQMAYGPK